MHLSTVILSLIAAGAQLVTSAEVSLYFPGVTESAPMSAELLGVDQAAGRTTWGVMELGGETREADRFTLIEGATDATITFVDVFETATETMGIGCKIADGTAVCSGNLGPKGTLFTETPFYFGVQVEATSTPAPSSSSGQGKGSLTSSSSTATSTTAPSTGTQSRPSGAGSHSISIPYSATTVIFAMVLVLAF